MQARVAGAVMGFLILSLGLANAVWPKRVMTWYVNGHGGLRRFNPFLSPMETAFSAVVVRTMGVVAVLFGLGMMWLWIAF